MDKHLLGTNGKGVWRHDLVVSAPELSNVFAHDFMHMKGTGPAPPTNRPHVSESVETINHNHALGWKPPVSEWVRNHVYATTGKLIV